MRFGGHIFLPRRPFHFLVRGSASGFAIFFAAFLHFTHVTYWMFVS
jgi:hypothetical protein